jgi:glyoxylase-like metal-dependent hydrolase (beta-lactamase superfamily II)
MRKFLFSFAILVGAGTSAYAAKLHVRVITSSPEGFSVNSTLVYGDKDAVLIDTQFLMSEARRESKIIQESRKNLTTVYITHGHPDHYFGLAVIKADFPTAKIVAVPDTVEAIKNGWDARVKFWSTEFGGNLPTTGPILPEELRSDSIMLEGEQLKIITGIAGDAPNNTVVWIPSIRTVVAGDTVFSGTHFTVPRDRTEWLKSLDEIFALRPITIIPGHQTVGAKQDLTALAFVARYMNAWDNAVASSNNADELRAKMKKLYPNLGLERLLNSAADAAFPGANKK